MSTAQRDRAKAARLQRNASAHPQCATTQACPQRAASLVRSQQGASFAIALLVFIVCAAISAVVLAASTAAIGQFAEQGKADARYYAVVSAEQLFIDSLNGSKPADYDVDEGTDTRTYVIKQVKTTTGSTTTPSVEFKKPDETAIATTGFDFLTGITYYAFAGSKLETGASSDAINTALTSLLTTEWLTPSHSITTSTALYTVPSPATDGKDVEVTGKLSCDDDGMTLELDFHDKLGENPTAEETSHQYHLYIELMASVITDELTGETTTTNATGAVTTSTTETRETAVVWSLTRVVPGGTLS